MGRTSGRRLVVGPRSNFAASDSDRELTIMKQTHARTPARHSIYRLMLALSVLGSMVGCAYRHPAGGPSSLIDWATPRAVACREHGLLHRQPPPGLCSSPTFGYHPTHWRLIASHHPSEAWPEQFEAIPIGPFEEGAAPRAIMPAMDEEPLNEMPLEAPTDDRMPALPAPSDDAEMDGFEESAEADLGRVDVEVAVEEGEVEEVEIEQAFEEVAEDVRTVARPLPSPARTRFAHADEPQSEGLLVRFLRSSWRNDEREAEASELPAVRQVRHRRPVDRRPVAPRRAPLTQAAPSKAAASSDVYVPAVHVELLDEDEEPEAEPVLDDRPPSNRSSVRVAPVRRVSYRQTEPSASRTRVMRNVEG